MSSRSPYYKFFILPTSSSITVDFVKSNGRITLSVEDAIIQDYIDAAVDCAEQITGRLLRPATLEGFYSGASFCASVRTAAGVVIPFVTIEKAPMTEVLAVNVWDHSLQAFTALSVEQFEIKENFAYWQVLFDSEALSSRISNIDSSDLQPYLIRVDFTAGYTSSELGTSTPPKLKVEVARYATWLYNNRGSCTAKAENGQLQTYRQRLSAYTISRVFA